ncbi:prepilin peptidase [Ahrensia marina]|jgi:prepilin peptidase CpaA|uniref:A24 family peptidase n=1 Tax=Ahrensia marina TaxID=1514904 RepID=UPI0035D0C4C7
MLELFMLVIFPGLVVLAGTMDLFTMTIPNKLCLAIVAVFFVAAGIAGLPLPVIGWHVAAALIALGITFLLFASGVFGGGDAKLTAAIVLWLGPTLALDFALLAALLGGILTAGFLVMRSLSTYAPAVNSPWAVRLLSSDVGIPYGIALSTAAMIVFTSSPWFLAAIAA